MSRRLLVLLVLSILPAVFAKDCGTDGEHPEIDIKKLQIEYSGFAFSGTLQALGKLGVDAKTVQSAAEETQKLNQIIQLLAAGYNSCAVTKAAYTEATFRMLPRLKRDSKAIDDAINAGQPSGKLEGRLQQFLISLRKLRDLSGVEAQLGRIEQKVDALKEETLKDKVNDGALAASFKIQGDPRSPKLILELANQFQPPIGVRELVIHINQAIPVRHAIQQLNFLDRAVESAELILPASPSEIRWRIPQGKLEGLETRTVTIPLRAPLSLEFDYVYVSAIEVFWTYNDVERRRDLGTRTFLAANDRRRSTFQTLEHGQAVEAITRDQQLLAPLPLDNAEDTVKRLRSQILNLKLTALKPDLDFVKAMDEVSTDAIRVLLVAGARRNYDGRNDFVYNAAAKQKWDAVAVFLEDSGNGRSWFAEVSDTSYGPEILRRAANDRKMEIVRGLFKAGVSAKQALIDVSASGDREMQTMILQLGIADSDDEALCAAARAGKMETVRPLLETSALNSNCARMVVANLAASGNNDGLEEILKKLAGRRGIADPQRLAQALDSLRPESGSLIDTAKLLLAAGADRAQISEIAIAKSPALAKLLVGAGADVNVHAGAAMKTAAREKNLELCRTLSELGAQKVVIPAQELADPIVRHEADLIECLVKAGADVNAKFDWKEWLLDEQRKRTPLMLAVSLKDLIWTAERLGLADKDYNRETISQSTAAVNMLRLLVKLGADAKVTTFEDRYAMVGGKLEKKGVNVSALMIALQSYDFQFDALNQIVRILVDAGADVNILSDDGRSPLIHYAILDDLEMVRFLLEHGANPNLKSIAGESALGMATDKAVRKLLIARGAKGK